MSTATFPQIRSALKARLATIAGLRTFDFVPDDINPPIAIAEPARVDYDQSSGRGSDDDFWNIVVITHRTDGPTGQSMLDAYCAPSGAQSIKAAIEGDRTLGGIVNTLRVTAMTSYGQFTQESGSTYLAATFAVQILT